MDFFKIWISTVAGVIVFSSLVEIIAPEGELKKYVKLILGMVVTVTLITPIGNINFKSTAKDFLDYDKALAFRQQNNFTDEENEKIIKLYTEKLEEKIHNELNKEINGELKVYVEVNTETKEDFGNIKDIYVVIKQKEGFIDYADEIKEILKEDFGISEERVRLKFVKG